MDILTESNWYHWVKFLYKITDHPKLKEFIDKLKNNSAAKYQMKKYLFSNDSDNIKSKEISKELTHFIKEINLYISDWESDIN